MSDTRKYRKFTAQQKTEIVLASLRGPKTMAELCREHDIADSLLASGASSSSPPAPSACRARPSAPRPTSCAARSRGWSARWGARRWRSRSRGNSCGDGSERARRPVPRARRARPPRRGGRPGRGDQPPGDLPRARRRPPTGQRRPLDARRPGRARGRARQPDRRHPDGRRARARASVGGRSTASACSG